MKLAYDEFLHFVVSFTSSCSDATLPELHQILNILQQITFTSPSPLYPRLSSLLVRSWSRLACLMEATVDTHRHPWLDRWIEGCSLRHQQLGRYWRAPDDLDPEEWPTQITCRLPFLDVPAATWPRHDVGHRLCDHYDLYTIAPMVVSMITNGLCPRLHGLFTMWRMRKTVNGTDRDGDERVLLCKLMYRVYYRYPKEITPELRYHDSKSSTYMTMTTY